MSAPVSITAFALQNEGNISTAFDAVPVTAEVTAFNQHLQSKLQASINLGHTKLAGSLKTGKYMSAYEFYGKSNTAALKTHFSAKYHYRIPFDALFTDGDKLKYFALNSGNMGMPALWGRYCMVFGLDYFKPEHTAVLRQNSLAKQAGGTHYYFNGKVPDENRIKDEICVLQQARQQCVIKKHTATVGCPANKYPELVCNSTVKAHVRADYVELLTTQDCLLDKNYTIRMTEQEYNLIFTATFDSYGNDDLKDRKGPLDRETDEFVELYQTHNFAIEVISV